MKKVFYFTAFMLCIVAGVSLTCFAQPTKNHVITEIYGDVVIDWYSESETLTPFDEGWGEGFCEGWKDVKGQNTWCPNTPWSPSPDWDCGDSYRCGYNRGFKYGSCQAQGYTNCSK